MKTILKWTACAACAVWTGASVSAATETVMGQNVIGLTTIENDSREYLPLAAGNGDFRFVMFDASSKYTI